MERRLHGAGRRVRLIRIVPFLLVGLIAGLVAPATIAQSAPLFRVLNEQIPPEGAGIIKAADLDVDGDVDLLTTMLVLSNDGAERFTAGPFQSWGVGSGDPAAFVVNDFSGDGFPDAIFSASPWLAIRLNDGTGTLAPLATIQPGTGAAYVNARAIAAADVDGDNDLDFCVTSLGTGTWVFNGISALQPRLFLNAGNATFTEVTATHLPVMSVFGDLAELRDFDADGDADLFFSRATGSLNATNPPNAYSLLLLNNGAGFFSAPVAVPGPGSPSNAAVGDLNGDGLPDVAYSPLDPWAVVPASSSGIVFNLGGNAFSAFVSTPLPGAGVLARDLNGDGSAEIIRSSASGVTVHSVAPNGTIAAPSQSIHHTSMITLAHDLDSDGDVDLCIDGGNRRTLVFNDATGTLVPIEGHLRIPPNYVTAVWGPRPHAVGDVDGDGDVDYVWVPTLSSSPLQVALNDGRGNLVPPGAPFCAGGCPLVANTARVMPLDFDADGLLDLYVAWGFSAGQPALGTDVIYRGTGAGWTQIATLAPSNEAAEVVQGDLDGDSDRDLVIVRHSASMFGPGPATSYVLFNLGGTFSTPVPLATGLTGLGAVLLDADGDLDLDLAIAVGAGAGAATLLFLNDGAGTFTQAPAGYFLPSATSGPILAGDLDLDGDVDLVLGDQTGMNGGTGTFSPSPSLPAGSWAVDLFDADLDGDLDVLSGGLTNSGNPVTWIIRNVGATFPGSEIVAFQWRFGPHADFDRDGDPDLVGPGQAIYSNTTRQIARGSTVRPGQNAVVELYGPPGSAWVLFASQGPANIAVPPFGTVLIDPATAFLAASGVFTNLGHAAFLAPVPNNPSVVGMSAHLQAGLLLQQRLSNLEVLTVLGL